MATRKDDDDDEMGMAEPPAARDTSVEKPIGTPRPRASAFGEGAEGRGARRERGLAGPRTGFFQRTSQFLRDTRGEMRRVSWPTLVMVRNTTLITLVAVVFFAVYLFAVDRVWTFLVDNLVKALGG